MGSVGLGAAEAVVGPFSRIESVRMAQDRQRDESLLRGRLQVLSNRGLFTTWSNFAQPGVMLGAECTDLAQDVRHSVAIRDFLVEHQIVQETVSTLLATLAMIANTKWQTTPEIVRPIARRGWHIGRWLPTFLAIDGPLGGFIKSGKSPLREILKAEHSRFPILSELRRAFNSDFFRTVRNGVGHWSFRWEHDMLDPHVVMVDADTGRKVIQISVQEGDALHLATFATIETLDQRLFSQVNPNQRT
jgi:hypothetical protein